MTSYPQIINTITRLTIVLLYQNPNDIRL